MINDYTTGVYESDNQKTKSFFENTYSKIINHLYQIKDAKLFGQCVEKIANDCILLSMNNVSRYDKNFQRQPITKSYSGKAGSWRVDGLFSTDTNICTITSKCKHLFDKKASISLAESEIIACIDLLNLFSTKNEHKNKKKDVYAIFVKPFSTAALNILKNDYPDITFHVVLVNVEQDNLYKDANICVESLETFYNNAKLILNSFNYDFRKALFEKQQQTMLQPSYTQLEKADEICQMLKEKGKCLEAIACRCGKNVISFLALKKYFSVLEGKIFLYNSSVPQSYDSVVEDAIKVFGDNINIVVQTKGSAVYDPTRLNLYIVSFQTLIKYSNKNKKSRIAFLYNKGKNKFAEIVPNADALIIDEAHFGFSDLRQTIEMFCDKTVKLYLTATPYSYDLLDYPSVELTHSMIFQNVADKKEFGRLANIPPLIISIAENITPDKFFAYSMAQQITDSNARPYLVKFVREIMNNVHNLSEGMNEYNSRFNNIFSDINPNIIVNNALIRVPNKWCGYALEDALNEIDENYPVIINETGKATNNFEVKFFCSDNNNNPALEINEFFNSTSNKHIAIVVDQAILAVTLSKLEATIDMSDTQSLAQYMQFRSRSLNPGNRNKIGLHIDCKPERALQMCSDYAYASSLTLSSAARVLEPVMRIYNKKFVLLTSDELETECFKYLYSSEAKFKNNLLNVQVNDFKNPKGAKVFDTNKLKNIFNKANKNKPDFLINEKNQQNAIVQKLNKAIELENSNSTENQKEESIEKLAVYITQQFKINTTTMISVYHTPNEITSFDDVLDKVVPYIMGILGKTRKEVFQIFCNEFLIFGDDFDALVDVIYNILGYDKIKSDITFKMISAFINIDKHKALSEQIYREILMEQENAVRKFGEVFTPNWLANDMIDLIPQESLEDINSTYLEPCCGSGIFLQLLIERLMQTLEKTIPNEIDRINHIIANQLYGVEIQEKNYNLTLLNLINAVKNIYSKNNKYCNDFELCNNIKNHLYNGDALKFDYWGKNDFTTIITNPPYHKVAKENCQDKNKAFALPFYIEFINLFKTFDTKYIDVVIPSRWMSSGIGTTQFRKDMLNDKHIKILHDYINGKDCFPSVEIKGGVCYFIRDINYDGNCQFYSHINNQITMEKRPLQYDNFCIRYNGTISILDKVAQLKEEKLSKTVLPLSIFSFPTNFKNYQHNEFDNSIQIYGNKFIGYIDSKQLKTGHKYVDKFKVLLPEAIGKGGFDDKLKPIIIEPNSCCTGTYVVLGSFDTYEEAKNMVSYINTKFFKFLLALAKNTQHATAAAYSFIPFQDFSKSWEDNELYQKYNLSEQEIKYIEEKIK